MTMPARRETSHRPLQMPSDNDVHVTLNPSTVTGSAYGVFGGVLPPPPATVDGRYPPTSYSYSDPTSSGNDAHSLLHTYIPYVNAGALVLFAFVAFVWLFVTLGSTTPAVIDQQLQGGSSPPPPLPPPPPSKPPPSTPPPTEHALRPRDTDPKVREGIPARDAGFEVVFYYDSGRPLAIDSGPSWTPIEAADRDREQKDKEKAAAPAHATRPTARTFYLLEGDDREVSEDTRTMRELRPEDLESYQCCCYDRHVSVCHSASTDLLPGYELACLLLYEDGSDSGGGNNNNDNNRGSGQEDWTLVISLGVQFARDAHCRLLVQPLPRDRRPDRETGRRLFS